MRFLSFLWNSSRSNHYDLANREMILICEMKHYKPKRERRKEMPKYEAWNSCY